MANRGRKTGGRHIPNLTGILPDQAAQEIQLLFTYFYDLHDSMKSEAPGVVAPLTLDQIRTALQSGAPRTSLNVNQLVGVLAQPQNAGIPSVTSLPAQDSPLSQDGGAVRLGGVLYVFNATTEPGVWQAVTASGVVQDTRANRSTYAASSYSNILFHETDSLLWYLSNGANWIYKFGTYRRTQSQIAALVATLGINDTNLLIDVTDYSHVLIWTGAAVGPGWGFGNPMPSGGYHFYEDAPAGDGVSAWQICDGSTVARLNADGTTTNVTVPDLATPAYLKGATTSAAVAAASGTVANTTATNQATTATNNSATTGITVDAHPSHTHDDASSLATPDLFAADTTGAGVAGRTGGPSAALTHTVNDAGHNHTQNAHNHTQDAHNHGPGSLELRNKQARLYYRR